MAKRILDWLFGYDFFISHRQSDGATYSQALAEALKKHPRRFDVFIDLKEYPAGANISALQERAVRKSARMIVVVTPGAHESPWVRSEVESFLKNRGDRKDGKVIPIGTAETLLDTADQQSALLALLPRYPDDLCILDDVAGADRVPSSAVVEKLANDFDLLQKGVLRERVYRCLSVVFATLAAAAGVFGFFADTARRNAEAEKTSAEISGRIAETNRLLSLDELASSLHLSGARLLPQIPTVEELKQQEVRPELPDDEALREAMAVLARSLRTKPTARPTAALLSHLILSRPWAVPQFVTPQAGFLQHTVPRFAGGGRWLVTCDGEFNLTAQEPGSDADPIVLTMDEGEELSCFTGARMAPVLLVGTTAKKVYVYDLEKNTIRNEIKLNGDPTAVACSDDGKQVAVAVSDGEVRLISYEGEQAKEASRKFADSAGMLAMDPAGTWLAAGVPLLHAWRCGTGQMEDIPIPAQSDCSCLAISPEHAVLMAGSQAGMRVFDLKTGKLLRDDLDQGFGVRSFAVHPLGAALAWGREVKKLPDHAQLSIGQNIDFPLAVSGRPVLKVFNPLNSASSQDYRFPYPEMEGLGQITELGVSADSSLLLSVHGTGNRVYLSKASSMLRNPGLIAETIQMRTAIRSVTAHPLDDSVLVADDLDAVIWGAGEAPPMPLLIHTPGCRAWAFSASGDRLALLADSGRLEVRDCSSGLVLNETPLPAGESWHLAWLEEGRDIMAVQNGKTVYKQNWNSPANTAPSRFDLATDWAVGPKFASDSGMIAGITKQGELAVWNPSKADWQFPRKPGFKEAADLEISADGSILGVVIPTSGEDEGDHNLTLYASHDAAQRGPVHLLKLDSEFVLSPRGRFVAVPAELGWKVIRSLDGKTVWESQTLGVGNPSFVFSPDERWLAVQTSELRDDAPNLQFWALPSARPVGRSFHSPLANGLPGKFTADSQFYVLSVPGRTDVIDPEAGLCLFSTTDQFIGGLIQSASNSILGQTLMAPSGCQRAIPLGNWLAVAPLVPDWGKDDAALLADLAESLAGKTTSVRGGTRNLSPLEIIERQNRIVERLGVKPGTNEIPESSSTWAARLVDWCLMDRAADHLSPWLDLTTEAWVSEALSSKDPSILSSVRNLEIKSEDLNRKIQELEKLEEAKSPLDIMGTIERTASIDAVLALDMLDQAIAVSPAWAEDPVNRGFRGYLRLLAGHPEGEADLAHALEKAPQVPGVRIWQARIHFVKGRYAEALAAFEACGALQPANPPLAGLAACQWKLNEKGEALELFGRMAKASPQLASVEGIMALPVPLPIQQTLVEIMAAASAGP